jgi:[citrate (pro-3S)-lyase] ligase
MNDLKEQILILSSQSERSRLESFLKAQDLSLDKNLEYSFALTDEDRIVATGSFEGNILKCIAVDEEYKSLGLSAIVITHLVNELHRRGRTHLFIYTKPANKNIFSELGFYPVAEVDSKVILMENRRDGIQTYLSEITLESGTSVPSAAVIVNCNPFTLGHRYLIEYAASRCEKLHIFVVWEDKSSFPAEIRYRLVKEGVSHLSNVVVHKGKDYIISNATFPSYFLKEYDDLVEIQAKIDLTIFSEYIAQALKIEKRFVGEEPYCEVTSAYNQIMKEMLPPVGIGVEEVPRLSLDGIAISASRVRELIRNGDIPAVKDLVPETTYKFLLSSEAEPIIRNIQSSFKRH